jgi:hypothetical protein
MILRTWQLPMALVVTLATDGHSSRVREMEGWRFGSGAGAHMAGGGGSVVASLARVTGTVYDSLIGGPLAGADVQLLRQGTPALVYNARTDSAGRFALDEVDGGTYQAGFFHPRLDSLGIELPTRQVTLSAVGRSDIELATPSRLTVLASVCPDTTRAEDVTLLVGVVRSSVSGAPIPRAVVSVQWSGLAIEAAGGLSAVRQAVKTPELPDGRFAICNVPADVGVTLRAAAGPDTSGAVAVTFPPLGIVSRDVYVAPLVSDQERAVARLTGRVTGRTGTPIFGARVSLFGWESAASTDSGGHFTFPQVPGGSTTLDVRSVGFDPVRLSIDLRTGEGARNDLAITMSPSPTTLAPVTVVDRRSEVLIRSGFDTRRHGALGRFIDEEALRKSGVQSTTSYLSQFPGMMARSGGRGMRMFMRDPQGLVCAPTVWVDGAPYLPAAEAEGVVDIDLLADITNIAGIEIYRRVNQAPLQFAGTTRSACGVIVIWRKGS